MKGKKRDRFSRCDTERGETPWRQEGLAVSPGGGVCHGLHKNMCLCAQHVAQTSLEKDEPTITRGTGRVLSFGEKGTLFNHRQKHHSCSTTQPPKKSSAKRSTKFCKQFQGFMFGWTTVTKGDCKGIGDGNGPPGPGPLRAALRCPHRRDRGRTPGAPHPSARAPKVNHERGLWVVWSPGIESHLASIA